ncbi:MAG: copper amine oxidase N-terminal domain-containing protein [Defluviitaleaceae bacterium]|nr:copper amine oxidase N-terminal domain-containing protein [Defluviitaleaceae bacterium]
MRKLKKIAAALLSSSLIISVVSAVAAQEQERVTPMFLSVTGQVMEIYPVPNEDGEPVYGQSLIRVTGDSGTTMFHTDYNTFVLGDEVQLGDTITGYYPSNAPMTMIYPPRHTMQLIVNGEFTNVHIDRFHADSERDALVSSDGSLQLSIGGHTQVILQDGQPFDGNLDGRILVAVYGPTTRSIPAITLPDSLETIVVLFERVVVLPQDIDPGMLEQIDEYIVWEHAEESADEPFAFASNNGMFINGARVDFTWQQVEDSFLVPVRATAEELGASVSWNYDTREVTVEGMNGTIIFPVGSADFAVNGVVVSLAHPSMLIGDTTYVPILFFRDVFGMNNAYMHAGEAHIDNEEPMR